MPIFTNFCTAVPSQRLTFLQGEMLQNAKLSVYFGPLDLCPDPVPILSRIHKTTIDLGPNRGAFYSFENAFQEQKDFTEF